MLFFTAGAAVAVSINHNISVITTGNTLLRAYRFKEFSCSNGTFVTLNGDYFFFFFLWQHSIKYWFCVLALLSPVTYGRKVSYLCAIRKEASDETDR